VKRSLKLYPATLAIAIALLSGCGNSTGPEEDNSLSIQFFLADSSGEETTLFDVGQEIYFDYSMVNSTGATLHYNLPHTGPFVRLEVSQADSLIGTSDDGHLYAQMILPGTLPPGHSLHWVYPWFSNEYHSALPPGEYTAWAKPRLSIYSIAARIDFVVSD